MMIQISLHNAATLTKENNGWTHVLRNPCEDLFSTRHKKKGKLRFGNTFNETFDLPIFTG